MHQFQTGNMNFGILASIFDFRDIPKIIDRSVIWQYHFVNEGLLKGLKLIHASPP